MPRVGTRRRASRCRVPGHATGRPDVRSRPDPRPARRPCADRHSAPREARGPRARRRVRGPRRGVAGASAPIDRLASRTYQPPDGRASADRSSPSIRCGLACTQSGPRSSGGSSARQGRQRMSDRLQRCHQYLRVLSRSVGPRLRSACPTRGAPGSDRITASRSECDPPSNKKRAMQSGATPSNIRRNMSGAASGSRSR